MDINELKRELAGGIITSLYFFDADDKYLADSYLKIFKTRIASGELGTLNLTVFTERPEPADVMNALRTLPVLSERRLVVIYLSDSPKPKAEDAAKSKAAADPLSEYLTEYAKNPVESSVLIVFSENADKRRPLYKAFAKYGKVVEFPKPSASRMPKWVEDIFTQRGYSIEPAAVRYLINALDYNSRDSDIDLQYFYNEIDKIIQYNPKSKKIALAAVKKLVSANISQDIFALTDAISSGNLAEANRQVYRLTYNAEAPARIFATIATNMRTIAVCQSLYSKGMSEADIAKSRGINPYPVKKAIAARADFTAEDALHALLVLANADMLIKRGRLDEYDALVLAVADITSKTFCLMEAE